jgi:putative transcription antitermination factor YqgF
MSKYLGIDYGRNKFGTAFSEGELASPGEVIQIGGLEDALAKVERIIEAEQIENVVIGLPESGEARSVTEKFIKVLENVIVNTGTKIFTAEETLSSKHGWEVMSEMGVSKKARKNEDAFAAAEILQDFLENRK